MVNNVNAEKKNNQKKIFGIESDINSNKKLILESRLLIEENRAMILNNYSAAYAGNTNLAITNTNEIYENRKSIISKIKVEGEGSQLVTSDVSMYSDGFIEVSNLNGDFLLKGINSKLVNENIIIKAETINGKFSENNNEKEINYLEVIDKNISYVKNNDTEMYAKKINFDYDTSIIELIDDVIIIRNEEKITGDYGTLDTRNNSYKIKSNNQKKVKVIIQNNE